MISQYQIKIFSHNRFNLAAQFYYILHICLIYFYLFCIGGIFINFNSWLFHLLFAATWPEESGGYTELAWWKHGAALNFSAELYCGVDFCVSFSSSSFSNPEQTGDLPLG